MSIFSCFNPPEEGYAKFTDLPAFCHLCTCSVTYSVCIVHCALCIPLVEWLAAKAGPFTLARRYCIKLTRNTTLQMTLNGQKITAEHRFAGVIYRRSARNGLFLWGEEKALRGVVEVSWKSSFVFNRTACFDGKTRRQHWFWFCSIDGMWPWESKKYPTVKTYQISQISQERKYLRH